MRCLFVQHYCIFVLGFCISAFFSGEMCCRVGNDMPSKRKMLVTREWVQQDKKRWRRSSPVDGAGDELSFMARVGGRNPNSCVTGNAGKEVSSTLSVFQMTDGRFSVLHTFLLTDHFRFWWVIF